ncbi:MAG: zinc ribbon domain-containing protein [Candidimonas sp.]|nr:zinc ribbon domain-containing protein [Candidimonas sp.]
MPIYVYQCSACQHTQDVLQKMSDPVLTDCPECGKNTYVKQVTAAGFQLKGSGWYVTDFRDGGSKAAQPAASTEGAAASTPAAPAVTSAPAPSAPTAPAAPSGGSSGGSAP